MTLIENFTIWMSRLFSATIWVGESEKGVREIFRKAKASSPCIVIFDELDALAKVKSGEGGAGETILSQLLTEIEDGTSSDRKSVV